MKKLFIKKGLPVTLNREGSMFTFFFTAERVFDYDSASRSDARLFARYFTEMLKCGISIAPSQFEAAFVSIAHTDEDFEKTLDACSRALENM